MQNDETTLDTQEEQQEGETADVEIVGAEEGVEEAPSADTTTPPEELTVEEKLAKAEAEAAKYKRLFNKAQKGNQNPTAKPSLSKGEVRPKVQSPSPVDVDERILKSQGMPDELLSKLRMVAKINNVSLIDAQTDPVFQGIKEKFEKEKKSKEASLPASKGSGGVRSKKDFNTPGLSREDHKKMFYEN
jgi:hypothetical protein